MSRRPRATYNLQSNKNLRFRRCNGNGDFVIRVPHSNCESAVLILKQYENALLISCFGIHVDDIVTGVFTLALEFVAEHLVFPAGRDYGERVHRRERVRRLVQP